jgi:hypothetical protein
MIDPALLNEGLNLGYIIAGCVDAKAAVEATEAVVNHMFLEDDLNKDLEISQRDFIKRFPEINITSNQMMAFPGGKRKGNMEQFSSCYGNSRDNPTALQYKCSSENHIPDEGPVSDASETGPQPVQANCLYCVRLLLCDCLRHS